MDTKGYWSINSDGSLWLPIYAMNIVRASEGWDDMVIFPLHVAPGRVGMYICLTFHEAFEVRQSAP